MINSLIAQRVGEWFQRPGCPAQEIISYIEKRGFFRDAQIEAIKTYLFLKIEGGNRPLADLFCSGFLTPQENLHDLSLTLAAREYFEADVAARSLYAFARTSQNGSEGSALPTLEKYLGENPGSVDCQAVARAMFYGVDYPDYLFSLPMGAGKTYLMAAFIYLDLYFAQNEPTNPIWAHNFIVLAPSGLKSSILPSLKTIDNFDPTCILPEPAASEIKGLIRFEVLDEAKTARKSNKARNPNAVKVSGHQPFDDLMGLVLVTNAEKVILDRLKVDSNGGVLFEETDDEKDKYANELRNLIGKIPNLQILIDEVHHAASDEIELRQVVNRWCQSGRINGVLGFSGTPYLTKPDPVKVAEGVSLSFSQITNTVFYWPLTRAIQGFLKKPKVKVIHEAQAATIVRSGVAEFQEHYGNLVYKGGQTAKLAIYCGSIERLEEEVFPLLLEIGIPADDILRYHRGNPKYRTPADAESEWKILDTPLSRKRIILLVQIGKEGWDCRSLAGVVLSQKGDCPANMVLQTSCRCLRRMDGIAADGSPETAGVWLNGDNAKVLNKQLKEEQHTSIEEINRLGRSSAALEMRPRYPRVAPLRLPNVAFYQMRVQFDTLITAEPSPATEIPAVAPNDYRQKAMVVTQELMSAEETSRRFLAEDFGETADFGAWLRGLAKGSFGALTPRDLWAYESALLPVFDAITYDDGGVRRFNALYDAEAIGAEIRLAFAKRRTLRSSCEVLSIDASLLLVASLKEVAADTTYLYPSKGDTEKIVELDAKGQTADDVAKERQAKYQMALDLLREQDLDTNMLVPPEPIQPGAIRHSDRSLHYVPYHFDSSFEEDFLMQALTYDSVRERGLELYFNGEGELTQFRIECFARTGEGDGGWSKVGLYTPDFLLIERKGDAIHRVLIVETKGSGFAKNFLPRRGFVENEWLRLNNDRFGYRRFDFLYLEDKMTTDNQFTLEQKVKEFFAN